MAPSLPPLAPGLILRISRGSLEVDIAPEAGGRIAQIRYRGIEQLVAHCDAPAMDAWGSFPMVPWAGRIRHGRFPFQGRQYRLPINLGGHSIHGFGFAVPWRVAASTSDGIELELDIPCAGHWPFAGRARQKMDIFDHRLRLELSLTAGAVPMPMPAIGWHPWFHKPDAMRFHPKAQYPKDALGLPMIPPAVPSKQVPGLLDDCFINAEPVELTRKGQKLRLSSSCSHWIIYDKPSHATCIEPQTGPPDMFNLIPGTLAAGDTVTAWFEMEWF